MTTGRKPPGFLTEDLQPTVKGPAKYTSRTDKAVEHIALSDETGAVIGYIYANDDDDAAGWVPKAGATPDQQNLAPPWLAMLRDAKQRGIKPSAALDEMLSAAPANKTRASSKQTSPSLDVLKMHAGH